jgi:hypothetical protein
LLWEYTIEGKSIDVEGGATGDTVMSHAMTDGIFDDGVILGFEEGAPKIIAKTQPFFPRREKINENRSYNRKKSHKILDIFTDDIDHE